MEEKSRNKLVAQLLQQWWKPILALCLILVGAWQVYRLGQEGAGSTLVLLQETRQTLEIEVSSLEKENSQLQEQMAILERSSQIDGEAYKEVVRNLQDLESQLTEYRKELAFYKGIVAPSETKTGLRIQNVEISQGTVPGHYRYSILLTQVAKNNKDTRGVVHVKVSGARNERVETLSLSEISLPKRHNWNFRFRYFQGLEGELEIPVDFRPDTFIVKARVEGKNKPTLERTFGWPD